LEQSQLFKKHACYLSICLLVAPLVATADALPVEPLPVTTPAPVELAPVQQALAQLPSVCPSLAPLIDAAALSRLQAFYQQQGNTPLWSGDERRQALHAQLLLLADDGLDPTHYSLPAVDATANVLCSDIDTSQHYLQALQDLHYGRLQQSRFEPLWHSQPPTRDPNVEVLAFAATGLQDMAQAFDQARPSADLYRSLRNAYSTVRQQPLPHWDPVATGPLLRPGMEDPRVPELARRLISGGYLAKAPSGKQYRDELVKAVKAFQLSHSLQADGVIGADPELAIDWLMSSLQGTFISVTVYDNLDALVQAHPDVVVMLDTHNQLLTQRNDRVEARFVARFYDANLQYIAKAEGSVHKRVPSVWVHDKAAPEIAAQIEQQRDVQLDALKQFDVSLKALVRAG